MGKWSKGQSGNPNGRPVGSKNKSKEAISRQLVADRSPEITEKLIEMGLEGDTKVLLYLADKYLIKNESTPIVLEDPTDIDEIRDVIIENVRTGNISPEKGEELYKQYTSFAKLMETKELDHTFKKNLILKHKEDEYEKQEKDTHSFYS